jgi:hypothetical protein
MFLKLTVHARSAFKIPSLACIFIPPQHDRWYRRRHQRLERALERTGLEIYTVPWATKSLLPWRRRAATSRRMGFGRCSPSTTSRALCTSTSRFHRGLLSLFRLARSEFVSVCRSFVFPGSFARVTIRTLYTRSFGRLNLLGFLLLHNALVDGQPGPRI